MRFIGSKVNLLENIKGVVDKHAINAESFCDIFSGTAAVARFFKQWYEIYSNDLLYFSYCLQKATIEMPTQPAFLRLREETGIENPIKYFNSMPTEKMEILERNKRFFQNNYSPFGGRMYITDSNALRIDYSRNTIEEWKNKNYIDEMEYFYLVAAVVEGVPFVSNIAGTYGAYSKTWDKRSYKSFELVNLDVNENGRQNKSYNEDGSELLKKIEGDILYIDPPYNERQYLPNYHLLETVAKYDFPTIHGTTGLRDYELQKSDFCSKKTVVPAFENLIKNANFEHIILSYNTEGIMNLKEIEQVMTAYGKPDTFEVNYIPYRRYKSKSNEENNKELKEMLIYISKEK